MNFPHSIKVNGVDYRIAVTDVMADSIAGGCHIESKVILVSCDQSEKEATATMFHELLHAIEVEYRVKLGHPKIKKLEYALAEIFEQLCAQKR